MTPTSFDDEDFFEGDEPAEKIRQIFDDAVANGTVRWTVKPPSATRTATVGGIPGNGLVVTTGPGNCTFTVATQPSGTIIAVPNQPKTPRRTFRISDELYEAAQAKAEVNGETVSDVVRRALEGYVAGPEVDWRQIFAEYRTLVSYFEGTDYLPDSLDSDFFEDQEEAAALITDAGWAAILGGKA